MELVILILALLIAPQVVAHYISRLNGKVAVLETRLMALEAENAGVVPAMVIETATSESNTALVACQPMAACAIATAEDLPNVLQGEVTLPSTSAMEDLPKALQSEPALPPMTKKKRLNFEKQFGEQLPIWVGAAALALAGFFLVKYSIDFLTPFIRIVWGLLFGCSMLLSGHWMRQRPNFANSQRLAQALSGAGIADLYFCVFAATNLYDFLPASVGFIGLASVTALGWWLSFKYGLPIAVLSLAGGYVAPFLVEMPSVPVLFLYLFGVLVAFAALTRHHQWWVIRLSNVIAALLWTLNALLSCDGSVPITSLVLGLFLIGASLVLVFSSATSKEEVAASRFNLGYIFNHVGLACVLFLMGFLTVQMHFGTTEWALLGCMSLSTVGLAIFNPQIYGVFPWLSMGVNLLLLFAWQTTDVDAFMLLSLSFGVLYTTCGYLLQRQSFVDCKSAMLSAVASLGFYVLAYYKLCYLELMAEEPALWSAVALMLALCYATALQQSFKRFIEDPQVKQDLLSIESFAAAAFIALASAIGLEKECLGLAFALQVASVAWLSTKRDIKALRSIVCMLGGLVVYTIFPEIVDCIRLIFDGSMRDLFYTAPALTKMHWPIFEFGGTALFCLLASQLLRRQRDDMLVGGLEVLSLLLILLLACEGLRQMFHIRTTHVLRDLTFTQLGFFYNLLFIWSVCALWLGQKFKRPALKGCGSTFGHVTALFIVWHGLLFKQPFFCSENVGNLPLWNGLLFWYALPAGWSWRMAVEMQLLGRKRWRRFYSRLFGVLAFAWVSFSVRQLFQGAFLNGSRTSHAEIYTYSAVWLALGFTLLWLGRSWDNQIVRRFARALVLLATGKVFLYDASELDGLLRVFSFLGLGLSLLGLGWLYTAKRLPTAAPKES